jgi:hypothetical protein
MRLSAPIKDITSGKIEYTDRFCRYNRMQKVQIKIGPPVSLKIPDEIAIVIDDAIREWYGALGYPIPEEIGLDILLAAMEIAEKK